MRLFPTREAKLAHWVDVYSVRILRIVVDNYPTTSITSIGLVPCGAFFVKRGRSPTTAVTLDEQGHRNMLSEIFEEYGSGFTEALGAGSGGKKTARDCLKLYLNEERLEKLQRLSGAKNAYHDYDWGLNDRATMLAQEPSR